MNAEILFNTLLDTYVISMLIVTFSIASVFLTVGINLNFFNNI